MKNLVAALVVIASVAHAQYPQGAAGFNVTTNLGGFAGNFCWGFSCTPATLNVATGEIVTVRISGEWQVPYILGLSSSATSCVSFPGILNSLVLDLPIVIAAQGTLSDISGILACPNGFTTLTAAIPPFIPAGTTFAIQAVTYGAGNVLAFTGAIVLTVT